MSGSWSQILQEASAGVSTGLEIDMLWSWFFSFWMFLVKKQVFITLSSRQKLGFTTYVYQLVTWSLQYLFTCLVILLDDISYDGLTPSQKSQKEPPSWRTPLDAWGMAMASRWSSCGIIFPLVAKRHNSIFCCFWLVHIGSSSNQSPSV